MIDSDDDVGVHLAHDVDGNVLDHAAVGQHLAVDFHGSEHAGNGHGGAHGLG